MTSSVRISVYVQPRASRTEFAGRHGAELKIRLRSPPVDDAANEELIEFLAQRLGVPKSHLRLVAGARGRRKTLEVLYAPADIAARLDDIAMSLDRAQQNRRMPQSDGRK